MQSWQSLEGTAGCSKRCVGADGAYLPPVTPKRAEPLKAWTSPCAGIENRSPNTPAKELRKQITLGNQLHSKKVSAMRLAYSKEIAELQDWNAALEDTLFNLMRTAPLQDILGMSLHAVKRHVFPDNISINRGDVSKVPQPVLELSSQNMLVLAQIAKGAPLKAANEAPQTSLQDACENGAQEECRTRADTRVKELERELQDLTEHFAQQMCIRRDDNNHRFEDLQVGRGALASKKMLYHVQSRPTTFAASDTGDNALQMRIDLTVLRSQVESLELQLRQKDAQLRLSNENNTKLREEVGSSATLQQAFVEEVDQALWQLNELSLDRARHTLERAAEGATVRRLDDLNQVVRKLTPQLHLLDAPQRAKIFLQQNHLLSQSDEGVMTTTHCAAAPNFPESFPEPTAATENAQIPECAAGMPRMRQSCVHTQNRFGALDLILERIEEASPVMAALEKGSSLDRCRDASNYPEEPDKPPFAPSATHLSSSSNHSVAPTSYLVPFCRQVSHNEIVAAAAVTCANDGASSSEDLQVAEPLSNYFLAHNVYTQEETLGLGMLADCKANSIAPARPPRALEQGQAQITDGDKDWTGDSKMKWHGAPQVDAMLHERMESRQQELGDVSPCSQSVEAPPSTPNGETQMLIAPLFSPTIQAATYNSSSTANCGMRGLFAADTLSEPGEQQLANIPMVKGCAVAQSQDLLCSPKPVGDHDELSRQMQVRMQMHMMQQLKIYKNEPEWQHQQLPLLHKNETATKTSLTGDKPATHCNTLQHTATHYKTSLTGDKPATHCNTLQHTATHYKTSLTGDKPHPRDKPQPTTVTLSPRKKESVDDTTPATKDGKTQGPHNRLALFTIDFNEEIDGLEPRKKETIDAPTKEETTHAPTTSVTTVVSKEGVGFQDRPPRRAPPPSPRQPATKPAGVAGRIEAVNKMTQHAEIVKPAPPGGKPRRSRRVVRDGGQFEEEAAGPFILRDMPPRMSGSRQGSFPGEVREDVLATLPAPPCLRCSSSYLSVCALVIEDTMWRCNTMW